MRSRLSGKMILSFGLLVSLILPSAGLANAKTDTPHIPSSLVQDKDEVVDKYSQLAAKYLNDCDDWDASGSSGEKLKRCLTIAKELRDKFDGFLQRCESIASRIKKEGKWTKELDDHFEKNAARRGVDATIISEVRQQGGLRASYQKNSNELRISKLDFDVEVIELETEIKKNSSSQNQLFQKISYDSINEPTTALPGKLKKFLRKAIETAAVIADALVTTFVP